LSSLGPEARGLVDAARAALGPTEADRARNLAALGARLPAGAFDPPPPGAAPAAASAGGLGWPALSAMVAGLVASAGVAWFTLRGPTAAPPVVVPAPVVPAQGPSAAVPPTTSTASPVAPSGDTALPASSANAPVAPAPRGTSRRSSDRLAEEVAILSHAETELHAGHYEKALALLEQHARSFPRGTLAPERIGAQVQALCGLGRRAEADAALRRLAPGSLQETRARAACGLKD
jgi:RNA polymerase sigma-70 factor (ECF subfamily)